MGTNEPFSQSIVTEDGSDETPVFANQKWRKNNESRLKITLHLMFL